MKIKRTLSVPSTGVKEINNQAKGAIYQCKMRDRAYFKSKRMLHTLNMAMH